MTTPIHLLCSNFPPRSGWNDALFRWQKKSSQNVVFRRYFAPVWRSAPKVYGGACHRSRRLCKISFNRFRFDGVISEKVISYNCNIRLRHMTIIDGIRPSKLVELLSTESIIRDQHSKAMVKGQSSKSCRQQMHDSSHTSVKLVCVLISRNSDKLWKTNDQMARDERDFEIPQWNAYRVG